ncbi:unnamed protein product [Somion occarium]|uniref:Uncharacterized protein n=1 Tax=Somion occarium TaxID=3059160 RepID=A0ABP1CS64_9APHY
MFVLWDVLLHIRVAAMECTTFPHKFASILPRPSPAVLHGEHLTKARSTLGPKYRSEILHLQGLRSSNTHLLRYSKESTTSTGTSGSRWRSLIQNTIFFAIPAIVLDQETLEAVDKANLRQHACNIYAAEELEKYSSPHTLPSHLQFQCDKFISSCIDNCKAVGFTAAILAPTNVTLLATLIASTNSLAVALGSLAILTATASTMDSLILVLFLRHISGRNTGLRIVWLTTKLRKTCRWKTSLILASPAAWLIWSIMFVIFSLLATLTTRPDEQQSDIVLHFTAGEKILIIMTTLLFFLHTILMIHDIVRDSKQESDKYWDSA